MPVRICTYVLVSVERVALADDLHAPDMNKDPSEMNEDSRSRVLTSDFLIRLGVDEIDDVERDLEDSQEEGDGGKGDVRDEQRTPARTDTVEHHQDLKFRDEGCDE